ncbi:hypothetical protein GALMADRAFT_812928 [Galerina marginata CBS 339.88]|uniref:Uncharacterized protein n=1 Tax=Galerina marginata (strain CBS 339.88) TaxID=685588 RepID=A0A067ST76_GALM3|nr:hypothetical protein GALMADRAFT_812928 [Galerina marginata CBS 339.88]
MSAPSRSGTHSLLKRAGPSSLGFAGVAVIHSLPLVFGNNARFSTLVPFNTAQEQPYPPPFPSLQPPTLNVIKYHQTQLHLDSTPNSNQDPVHKNQTKPNPTQPKRACSFVLQPTNYTLALPVYCSLYRR